MSGKKNREKERKERNTERKNGKKKESETDCKNKEVG